jgi:hypothetical protein
MSQGSVGFHPASMPAPASHDMCQNAAILVVHDYFGSGGKKVVFENRLNKTARR